MRGFLMQTNPIYLNQYAKAFQTSLGRLHPSAHICRGREQSEQHPDASGQYSRRLFAGGCYHHRQNRQNESREDNRFSNAHSVPPKDVLLPVLLKKSEPFLYEIFQVIDICLKATSSSSNIFICIVDRPAHKVHIRAFYDL